MNAFKLIPIIAAGMLAIAPVAGLHADDKSYGDGADWVEHIQASSGPLKMSILGLPGKQADREIALSAQTRYINVARGETVTFTLEGKAFTWNFDTLGTPNFDFSEIAPKDFGATGARVYVSPSPADFGG